MGREEEKVTVCHGRSGGINGVVKRGGLRKCHLLLESELKASLELVQRLSRVQCENESQQVVEVRNIVKGRSRALSK